MNVPTPSQAQSLPETLWQLRDQIFNMGVENQNANPEGTSTLTEAQIATIRGRMEEISGASRVSNQAFYNLRSKIGFGKLKQPDYGFDRPDNIVNELNRIAMEALQSNSGKAAEGTTPLPFSEKLRTALQKAISSSDANAQEDLNRLLMSEEFKRSNPSETALILPQVADSKPDRLIEIFKQLTKNFALQINDSFKEGMAAGAAAGGAACAAAAASVVPKREKEIDSKELEKFKIQVADMLAPYFFKHLKKAFCTPPLQKNENEFKEQRELLLNSPLFRNISIVEFQRQMNLLFNSSLSPEQGEKLLDVVKQKFQETRSSGNAKASENEERNFLRELSNKVDFLTALKTAAAGSDENTIDAILSCNNLLEFHNAASLIDRVTDFQINLIGQSIQEAQKFLKVLTHPKWVALEDERLLRYALLQILKGETPYTTIPRLTWDNKTPVKVDLQRLADLLTHPSFSKNYSSSEELENLLLMATTTKNNTYPLPFLNVDTQRIIIQAIVQQPQLSRKFVRNILRYIYGQTKEAVLIFPHQEIQQLFLEIALGDQRVREPIENCVKKREQIQTEEPIDAFKDYINLLYPPAAPKGNRARESEEKARVSATSATMAAQATAGGAKPSSDAAAADPKNRILTPLERVVNPTLALERRRLSAADLLITQFCYVIYSSPSTSIYWLLQSELFFSANRFEVASELGKLTEDQSHAFYTHRFVMNRNKDFFMMGFERITENRIDWEALMTATGIAASYNKQWFNAADVLKAIGTLLDKINPPNKTDSLFDKISSLFDATVPQKTLEMVLKGWIQNPAIFNSESSTIPMLFIFPDPEPNPEKPKELVSLSVKGVEKSRLTNELGRPPFKISNALLKLAHEWMLENFSNLELPPELLLNLAKRAIDLGKEHLVPRLLEGLEVKTIPQFTNIINLLARTPHLEKGGLVPLLIDHLDRAKQNLNLLFPQLTRVQAASADASHEAEVKIRASDAAAMTAAAAEAAADRGGDRPVVIREELLRGYDILFGSVQKADMIDLIVKNAKFGLIAQDVIDALKRNPRPGESENLWLDRLKKAGMKDEG